MPLITDEAIQPFEGQATTAYSKPTVMDQLGAALERENTFGAAFSSKGALPSERSGVGEYDFKLEENLTDQEKAYRSAFVMARSREDVDAIRGRIAGEQKSRATMADGPLPEWVAGAVAGIADPVQYLPALGPLTRAGKGALAIGGSVTISTAASEFGLSQRQYERHASESAANIIVSVALGSTLGAVAGAFGKYASPTLPHPDLVKDVGAIIRNSGLTGAPRPVGDLMSTTAVSRFLDRSPDYHASGNQVPVPDTDLLNALTLSNPTALNRINNAADNMARLQAKVAGLSLDSRTAALEDINARSALYGETAKALREIDDQLTKLKAEGGDPTALLIRRANRVAQVPEVARLKGDVYTNLEATLKTLADARSKLTPEAETLARTELMNAVGEHASAKVSLGKQVADLKTSLQDLGRKLGPEGRAAAKADILKQREDFLAHLEAGKPMAAFKQHNPMDWLKGIAADPKLSQKMEVTEPFVPAKEGAAPKSVSAAATPSVDTTLSQLAASYKIAEITAKLKKIGLAAPSLELGTSIFDTARRAVLQIVDTGMATKGNMLGIPNPNNMWTEIKLTAEADIFKIDRIIEAAWKDHKEAWGTQRLKKAEFLKQVAYAMRRDDLSNIKEVQELAKELRVFDKKYKDLAIEHKVGVFKDGDKGIGKTAPSHFFRAYDNSVLKARYSDFIDMVTEFFGKQGVQDAKMKFKDGILVDKEGKPVDIMDDPRELAGDTARSVYHKIMSFPDGRLPAEIKVPEGRGAAKERTFNIPDNFVSSKGVRFEDFLDNNPINVMSRYVKTLGADVAYQKTMGGDEGLKEIIGALEEEATSLAKAAKSPQDSARILKQFEHEAQLIQALTERTRGVSAAPLDPRYDGFNRVLKSVRAFNVIRSLGSVIFSQLPDTGTVIMTEGMTRVFGGIIREMVTGFSGIKLGVAEGRRLGTATDMYLMGRSGAIVDLGERYRNVSKAETVMDTAAHYAMIGFGIAPWTTAMKGLASHLGGDSILRGVLTLAEGGKISERLRAQLARDGIGIEEARLIAGERDNFIKHNGLWISNAQTWKNEQAKNLFASALVQRVDNAVITPNHGDAPLWTGTELGKTFFQFKRFGWASNQRTLIAGAQLADIEAFNAVVAMVGLGMLGTLGRDISAKGEPDKSRSVAGWAREGIDRSGVVSQFMEGDALLDKATGGHGITRTLTGQQAQRYASTGFIERAGGPTVGLLADTSKALSGVADGTLSGADVHNMTRLLPARNFPATRYFFDQMEQKLVDSYGLPPRQIK